MKKFNSLTALVSVLFLAGCMGANTAVSGGTAPDRASGGLFGLGEAKEVTLYNEQAFKGANKVVIGGFKVGFVESKADSSKAGGGLMGNGFGGKSTAKLKIEGLSPAAKQSIADAAYQDFIARLKSQGYEIVDSSALYKSEAFAGVKKYPAPYQKDNSGILSDYGMTTYYAPTALGTQMPIFMGEIMGETGGFAFANPAMGAAKFAEETGIRVVNVSYVLDFANAAKYGGSFTSSSSVNVGQGLSVVPGAVLGITKGQGHMTTSGSGSITTGQPIYSTEEFGTIVDTTTGTAKGVEVATNIIGALGGIGTNVSREYIVQADPTKYQTIAMKLAGEANGKLVQNMVANR